MRVCTETGREEKRTQVKAEVNLEETLRGKPLPQCNAVLKIKHGKDWEMCLSSVAPANWKDAVQTSLVPESV